MTTAAKTFTRTVNGTEWTFKADPFTGIVSATRGSIVREGHTYPGFSHGIHGKPGRPMFAMLREAVALHNRLRSGSSLTMAAVDCGRLAGRRGALNPNSCREARRVSALIAAHAGAKAAA